MPVSKQGAPGGNPQARVLEVPSETEVRSAWGMQGAHSNSGGSTTLTGSHTPPPSQGSAHLCSRVKEELGVDGKAPCCWTSWDKAVVATECG